MESGDVTTQSHKREGDQGEAAKFLLGWLENFIRQAGCKNSLKGAGKRKGKKNS